ncbi:type III secretion system chaperone [Pseudomonas abietaniphila]|uniref:type III secretion system chaperone n=1 Tax=Pseudomonas abietaniphila TaxID=89065 RepID=UPI0007866F99|nr:type III secretion system chaperone [Pseudomonas abietaniphila]
MNTAPPTTTLTMGDLRAMTDNIAQPASKPKRLREEPVRNSGSGSALDISPTLQSWLLKGAQSATVEKPQALAFSTSGLLTLGSTRIMMFNRPIGPVTEWWVQGYLQPPSFVARHQWHEMLLWANSVAPGLDHCSFGLNEQGTAVASLRIPFHLEGDVQALSGALSLMGCLADSLALGISHQPSADASVQMEPIEGGPVLDADGQVFRERLKQHAAASAAQSLTLDWHLGLVDQMLGVLDIERKQPLGTVSSVTLMGLPVEIMADGDGRSLLLSTVIKRPLRTAAQHKEALVMNLHLMTLAGACIALDPKGTRLFTRWDATGLDGQALADTLMSFVMLALSLQTPDQPVRATTSLSARTFQ